MSQQWQQIFETEKKCWVGLGSIHNWFWDVANVDVDWKMYASLQSIEAFK